jgi:hypothetical protein
MGYAYTDLIVPAVLYSNPGLKRENLLKLLKEVHFSWMREYSREEKWNKYYPDEEDHTFDSGLESIASVLNLPKTRKFKEFQKYKRDENGLRVDAPFLIGYDYKNQKFEVVVHEKNILEKEKNVYHEISFGKVSEGDNFAGGIVKKILREEDFGNEQEEDEFDFDRGPTHEYDVRIIPIKSVRTSDTFYSEKDLYAKYPLFKPDNKYVWSKNKGKISTGLLSDGKYFWKKEKGKYYLDEKTFEILCEDSRKGFSFGYTDLVMTSEAINKKAWKLLSYRGFIHIGDFLKDFPSSNLIHKKAVYDLYLSIFAKKNKMTNSELLRYRLMNPQKIDNFL